MSALKTSGYGDGRTGSGAGGDFMFPEHNGSTPSGMPLPGVCVLMVVPLGGQPPVGAHGNWGDLTWVAAPKVGEGL